MENGNDSEGRVVYAVNLSPVTGELAVLSAGHHGAAAGSLMATYLEKNYTLAFIERGTAECSCYAGAFPLCEGDCCCISPNRYMSLRAVEPVFYRFLTFGGSSVQRILDRIGLSGTEPVCRLPETSEAASLFDKVYRLLLEKRGHYDLQAGGYLRLILSAMTVRAELVGHALEAVTQLTPNEIDHRIRDLIEWMSARYADRMTVGEMAERTGYSERYFRKAFQRATGLAPTEFLTHIRMDRAKHLLFEPLSVKQIARSVGYEDPLYFSKRFKRHLGLSPGQFREYAKARLAAGELL